MAQLLPDHLHPSQQRLQLLDLQRRSHQLAAREDRQLAVEDALTSEGIRREFPDDLKRVLIHTELEFTGNRAPERRPLLEDKIADLQLVVGVAGILSISALNEAANIIM